MVILSPAMVDTTHCTVCYITTHDAITVLQSNIGNTGAVQPHLRDLGREAMGLTPHRELAPDDFRALRFPRPLLEIFETFCGAHFSFKAYL
jgi:hypothetical protein